MSGFGKLLKKGQRRHEIKSSGGKWGRCEECDERTLLYPFDDEKEQVWMLCDRCTEIFVNDEGDL